MRSLFRGATSAAVGLALVAGGVAMAVRSGAAPRLVVVRLEGNAFRPDQIHARAGDTVKFVNGNGGPHNVKLAEDSIAAPARTLLEKAFGGEKIGPLSSPLLLDPGEAYSVVIPAIPVGRYPLYCLPHMANMRASLLVDP
jgi:plastocyanin